MNAEGFLSARFARDGAGTSLSALRWQPPLQAMRLLHPDGPRGAAELVLATLGPGLMGGDRHRVQIEAGPGARARVTTTGAARVLAARSDEPTLVRVDLAVEAGGYLEWLPHPTIVQAHARYGQHVRLALAPEARAIVGEIVVPGRLAAGERFAFRELDLSISIVEARSECDPEHAAVPLVAERVRIAPGAGSSADIAPLPWFDPVMATLHLVGCGMASPGLGDRLAREIPGAAVSTMPGRAGSIVRLFSGSGSAAMQAIAAAVDLVRAFEGPNPPDAPHRAPERSVCAGTGLGDGNRFLR